MQYTKAKKGKRIVLASVMIFMIATAHAQVAFASDDADYGVIVPRYILGPRDTTK